MFDSVKYLLIVTFKLANFATLFAATKVRKMRIPSNKVQDIVRFAHSELDDVYGKEEREAGIRRLIEDNLEEKKTKEIIIQKLIRWFSMDEQTAQLYLDKYADSENKKNTE